MIRHESEHVLYRIYDAKDVLLYIGVTTDVMARMAGHRATTHEIFMWGKRVETSTPYPNYALAHDAEKAAIADECPVLNRQHNPKRWMKPRGQGWVHKLPPYEPPRSVIDPASREALTATLDRLLAGARP